MSFLQLVIYMVLIVGLWGAWSLRDEEDKVEYFKTLKGKDILRGILAVLGFMISFATLALLFGCQDMTYFNDASVYAGLEYAKENNQICERDAPDDRTVSNVGLSANLARSFDKRLDIDATVWQHHSCAFNPDDKVYDAYGGIKANYKFWIR